MSKPTRGKMIRTVKCGGEYYTRGDKVQLDQIPEEVKPHVEVQEIFEAPKPKAEKENKKKNKPTPKTEKETDDETDDQSGAKKYANYKKAELLERLAELGVDDVSEKQTNQVLIDLIVSVEQERAEDTE